MAEILERLTKWLNRTTAVLGGVTATAAGATGGTASRPSSAGGAENALLTAWAVMVGLGMLGLNM
jgi:hypothetical protein